MKALSILIVMSLIGCASGAMLPADKRVVTYVEKVKASKEEAYSGALKYLSKNLGDSNSAIKMSDGHLGEIVSRGNTTCKALNQPGDITDYSLSFNLDIKVKKNKIKIHFEDILMTDKQGSQTVWAYLQITSKENLEKIKPCLVHIKNGILSSIKKGSSDF